MAFVLPYVGYGIYRLLARRTAIKAPAHALYAGMGAYIGLNAAAAVVAVLLVIQPALFHEPNGHALYFPFGLHITLPAMRGTHLLIAGPAEAIVTVLVVRYLQTAGIPLWGESTVLLTTPGISPAKGKWRLNGLWIGMLVLIALSPLGLLAKGEAWGEWDKEGLAQQIEKAEGKGKAYVPKGVAEGEEHGYKGIGELQDYASEKGPKGYILASVLGTGVILGALLLGGRLLVRQEESLAARAGNDADEERYGAANREEGDLPDWLRRSGNPPPSDRSG